MQTIYRNTYTTDFTVIKNDILNSELSGLAKAVLIYLLSKPPHWRLRATDIKRFLKCGINKVYRILQELRTFGYIIMTRTQSAVQWFVYDTPQQQTKTATGRAESHRDGFHHDGSGDDLVITEVSVKTENYNNPPTVPEPITAPANAIDVVVQRSINEKDQHQTHSPHAGARLGNGEDIDGIVLSQDDCPSVTRGIDGVGIDNIPGIDERYQQTARKALERLTPEQAQAVLVAFTLAASKTTITNKIGYLISLTNAAIDGTFSPIQPSGGAPAITLDERLRRERARQKEQQRRGAMSSTEHAEWLQRTYGTPNQSSIACKLKKLQSSITSSL